MEDIKRRRRAAIWQLVIGGALFALPFVAAAFARIPAAPFFVYLAVVVMALGFILAALAARELLILSELAAALPSVEQADPASGAVRRSWPPAYLSAKALLNYLRGADRAAFVLGSPSGEIGIGVEKGPAEKRYSLGDEHFLTVDGLRASAAFQTLVMEDGSVMLLSADRRDPAQNPFVRESLAALDRRSWRPVLLSPDELLGYLERVGRTSFSVGYLGDEINLHVRVDRSEGGPVKRVFLGDQEFSSVDELRASTQFEELKREDGSILIASVNGADPRMSRIGNKENGTP